MSQIPPPSPAPAPRADEAVTVVSAYGAFRLLLILLAVWSFFAGFALLTQGAGPLSFGDDNEAAQRVLGAHMMVLAPVYGLLAWRRSEYRLFLWIPYAAQLAIVLPSLWELVFDPGDFDGAVPLIVSIIFLALLVYVWTSSRPLSFFQTEEDEDDDESEGDDDDDANAYAAPRSALDDASARARRYRRSD